MDYNPNLTVEEYGTWLIQRMATLDDGEEYTELAEAFQAFCTQINFLEHCYRLPYETDRRD